MKITLSITLFFALAISNIHAQKSHAPKNVRSTIYYSFYDVKSLEQIEYLKTDIQKLKGVTKVKSEYKEEKMAGQVIVVVEQQERTSEGQKIFSVQDLKKLIIKNNLTPNQINIESEVIKK